MIGGVDIQIATRSADFSVEASVRVIRQKWPNAVFEYGETGEPYEHFRQIPFSQLNEIFVYRDPEATRTWNAEGAVPEVSNLLIHLIADEDMLTVVTDKIDDEMVGIVAAIRSGLSDVILYNQAWLETI